MAPSFLTLKLKGWPSEILGCWYPCCIDIGPSPFHTTVFLSVDWFEGTCCRKPWSHGYHGCKDHGFRSVDFPSQSQSWSWDTDPEVLLWEIRVFMLWLVATYTFRVLMFGHLWPIGLERWRHEKGGGATLEVRSKMVWQHTHTISYIYIYM